MRARGRTGGGTSSYAQMAPLLRRHPRLGGLAYNLRLHLFGDVQAHEICQLCNSASVVLDHVLEEEKQHVRVVAARRTRGEAVTALPLRAGLPSRARDYAPVFPPFNDCLRVSVHLAREQALRRPLIHCGPFDLVNLVPCGHASTPPHESTACEGAPHTIGFQNLYMLATHCPGSRTETTSFTLGKSCRHARRGETCTNMAVRHNHGHDTASAT